ncbi:MAG: MarC family protein [Bacteroidales bacterium]|nr:MarC family protein [Bacteroidales bacterium]
MTNYLHPFIHLVFIGLIALFPVVNPIGTAFMVNPYFSELTRKERIRVVKRIAFFAFCISALTLFTGHWILELFGLSVPVIQLAGGIMICKIGWEFLSSDKPAVTTATIPEKESNPMARLENKLFYPITFPMTTGAGTIAVLFTLSAHGEAKDLSQYLYNTGALLVSIIGICILIFIFYINADRLIKYLGSRNEIIVNRLMAFLIFCVGLQIAIGGITHLIKG